MSEEYRVRGIGLAQRILVIFIIGAVWEERKDWMELNGFIKCHPYACLLKGHDFQTTKRHNFPRCARHHLDFNLGIVLVYISSFQKKIPRSKVFGA